MSVSFDTLALCKEYTNHVIGMDEEKEYISITIGTSWSGSDPYTQSITIEDYEITANTKVDLIGNKEARDQLEEDGVASIYIKNDDGVLTAVANGGMTTAEITVSATLMEVE